MLKQKNISYLLITLFFILFFWWIFIAVNSKQSSPPQPATSSSPLTAISGLSRVIDGDTIEINKNRIRLIGIDAPESKQKCLDKNYNQYLCGEASTAFLKKIIANQNVSCFYDSKDVYNRYLGNCRVGEVNINYAMVKNGMAIIYNLKEASPELKVLENEAKSKKLGIWQGAFEEPKQYRKTHHFKTKSKN